MCCRIFENFNNIVCNNSRVLEREVKMGILWTTPFMPFNFCMFCLNNKYVLCQTSYPQMTLWFFLGRGHMKQICLHLKFLEFNLVLVSKSYTF